VSELAENDLRPCGGKMGTSASTQRFMQQLEGNRKRARYGRTWTKLSWKNMDKIEFRSELFEKRERHDSFSYSYQRFSSTIL